MSKKALGKGIGALFREMEQGEKAKALNLLEIPIAVIEPNPLQPRVEFSQEKLKELADSIGEKGILQPILVEPEKNGSYTVVAGERRLRAAKIAGLKTVPAIVKQTTREELLMIALIENVQREDLTPMEEAKGYKRLIDETKMSQEEIARRVGKDRSTVANGVRLLKLPQEMQDALSGAKITAGHARALLAVVDPVHRNELFQRILERGLTVRQTEAEAQKLNTGGSPAAAKKKPGAKRKVPELEGIEQRMIEEFGTKVKISGSLNAGRIEISYFSQDDLSSLMTRFGLKEDRFSL